MLISTDALRRSSAIWTVNIDNSFPQAKVVWTNYRKDLDLYHGALRA